MQLSDRQLRRWYRHFNQAYISGQLPDDADLLYAPIDGGCGDAVVDDSGGAIIRIDPAFTTCTRVIRIILLHEMAHVKLWPYRAHGARFDAEIDRLYAAGAYKGLL